MFIEEVIFKNQINAGWRMDELCLIINEKFEQLECVRYRAKKVDNGIFWCKWYEGGLASYGFTEFKDPLHGNQKYTWSSRAEVINNELNLPWEWQLAKWDCAVKFGTVSGCYCSMGITKKLMKRLMEKNKTQLHYSLEESFAQHCINNNI